MQEVSKVLLKEGYRLIETIKHNEFNTFILRHKWQYSILHLFYTALLSFTFLLTLYLIVCHSDSILSGLLLTGFGILLAILFIPIHESIHYLMFKFCGAKKATIKSYFHKFYFLTISHHFPIGKKEISWIALMPFIVFTILGVVLFFLSSYQWQIILISAILFHTSICSADFRLVDFFFSQQKEFIMYSDIDEEVTYLFGK